MEFKAKKIKVDLANPYENDKLSRKADIDNLSLLLRNFSTPIVLSINAPWGQGKTTFLEMLHSDLLNKNCQSLYFSAWETDFAVDPLLAFLGEMNLELDTLINDNEVKNEAWNKAKKAGSHILKKGIPALIKLGTAGVLDAEKLLEDETSKLMEGFSKDLIAEYSSNKDAIALFKESIAKLLSNDDGTITKLYIFIDELDRCRPTYAIELLERIKHLLDIEGLVFVLALDKLQLSHCVKGVYGADFEALGYLRRFIDIEYNLPEKELSTFIDQLYKTFDFDNFFQARKKCSGFQYEVEHLRNVFKLLASSKNLSLREVEQLFSKINLVIHSTKENTHLYPALLAFLIIVKEFHTELYLEYIREGTTADNLIEYLYGLVPESDRYESFECALIEGFLIAAKRGMGTSLEKHKENLTNKECEESKRSYSEQVIRITQSPTGLRGGVALDSLVSRIEMSENFIFGETEA
jgi:hypothetical protein